MNEEVHCITNEEKRLSLNGKMMTLTFWELYSAHMKNYDNSFSTLTRQLV